jgi:mannose-6-phosphate isomerase-like protein (cupin superfamily)
MVDGSDTGGGFALVEHPLEPRALAAPMHRHTREDEYSFILEGRVGAVLGGETIYAEAGDLLFKPRDQWHTFWNATDEPARLLEIISPAGFESFFEQMTDLAARGELSPPRMKSLAAEFGAEVDVESVPRLIAEHGLAFPH